MSLKEEKRDLLAPFQRNTPESVLEDCLEASSPKSLAYVLTLGFANAADAVEVLRVGYIMNEISTLSKSEKENLSAAVYMGMFCGGILCGVLSDRIGRKPCLEWALLLNSLAAIASAFSPNITALIIFRVIAGVGIGATMPSVFGMAAEIFPWTVRGKMISIVVSFWMVGAIFTALLGWMMLGKDFHGNTIMPMVGWRTFTGVCAIPAIISLILARRVLPESAKFLLQKQRYADAADVLSVMSSKVITAEMLTPANAIAPNDSPLNGDTVTVVLPSAVPDVSLFYLFLPIYRYTSTLFVVIWFTLCFSSYGLSTWINVLYDNIGLSNVYASSFVYALASLPGYIFAINFLDKVGGKRNLLMWSLIAGGLSAIGFGLGTKIAGVVIVSSTLFNGFAVVCFCSLDVISLEAYPTNVRTTAMGVFTAVGKVGAVVAQFVNGELEHSVSLLLFVTSCCMMVGAVACWCLPQEKLPRAVSTSSTNTNNPLRLRESA